VHHHKQPNKNVVDLPLTTDQIVNLRAVETTGG